MFAKYPKSYVWKKNQDSTFWVNFSINNWNSMSISIETNKFYLLTLRSIQLSMVENHNKLVTNAFQPQMGLMHDSKRFHHHDEKKNAVFLTSQIRKKIKKDRTVPVNNSPSLPPIRYDHRKNTCNMFHCTKISGIFIAKMEMVKWMKNKNQRTHKQR